MNKHKKTEYDVHHIGVNICNGGSNDPNNLIRMKRKKHEAYHILFENMSFKEALIELFLMGEKTLKNGQIKKDLRYCLNAIDINPKCFKK